MPKKILIIDDDVELCREMLDILEREGYSVDSLSSPEGLEKVITQTRYDVILLDFKIPHSDGIDTLRNIIQKSPGSKVFVSTGKPFIETLLQEHGLLNHVHGVFNKPFDIEAMLEKIK